MPGDISQAIEPQICKCQHFRDIHISGQCQAEGCTCHQFKEINFDDSEFGQAFQTWVDDFQEMDRWNAVHKALSELYELWAKQGAKGTTLGALENLMRVYDKWLN